MHSRAWSLVPLVWLLAGAPAAAHETAPAAPCEVLATPQSTTEVKLFWSDVANNESSIRVEQRALGGQFTQVQSLPANSTSTTVGGLAAGGFYEFRVRSANAAGFSPYSTVVPAFTDQVVSPSTCAPNPTTLCLNQERFRIQVQWETSTAGGAGNGQTLNDDSGAFTFFNPNNTELLLKVLNGCGVNQRYWVFASGLTNVAVQVTVTDTQAGRVRRYFNPQGKAFAPVQDTSAFATCP